MRINRVAAVNDLNVLGAGLNDLGIPKDSVTVYERAIKIGKYALVACGTAEEVATASGIIEAAEPSALARYSLKA